MSVQEKSCFRVLYYPLEPLLQLHARHCAACHNGPRVRLDRVQTEALRAVITRITTLQRSFAYLADLIVGHRTVHVAFVLEYEETRAHQTLQDVVSIEGSTRFVAYFFHEQFLQFMPAVVNPFAVSSINNPDQRVCLLEVVLPVCAQGLLAANIPYIPSKSVVEKVDARRCSTYVQFVSVTVSFCYHEWPSSNAPIIFNRLDDEAKSRTDAIDILVHDLLYDGCLSCIVKASDVVSTHYPQYILAPTASVSSSPCPSVSLSAELTAFWLTAYRCRYQR